MKIATLDEKTYKDAVRIAVESNTGEQNEIQSRLKTYERYYVALEDGKVVGEIGWYQDDGSFAGKSLADKFPYGQNVYWLSHFSVDINSRNQGVGKLLLDYLENVLKSLGGKELWVYTSQAKEYYKKNGFVFIQKFLIDEAWQDVLMKKL